MKRFNLFQIKTDLRRTFFLSSILSITVFAWLRIIFFDIPFSFTNEGFGLLKTVLIYWALIFSVKMILNLVLELTEKLQRMPSVKVLITRIAFQ